MSFQQDTRRKKDPPKFRKVLRSQQRASTSQAKAFHQAIHLKQQKAELAAIMAARAEEFEAQLAKEIIINVKEVRYDIVKNLAKKVFGWRCTRQKPDKESGSEALTHAKADWDIIWIDADFHVDRLRSLKPYQKINHFPGMTVLTLKNNLAKYLKLMQKAIGLAEFGFFPKTWIFPYESYELVNYIQEKKRGMTFIVKPINSCQGKGIFLTRKVKTIPRTSCHVVQLYKQNPYLIDGKKFDFRLYVLITQVTPDLHCFLYNDGLARFATEEYTQGPATEENLYMHLTNYAINKESSKFEGNETNFKKSLIDTLALIAAKEGQKVVDQLVLEMKDILLKTVLMGWPHLDHNYRTCSSKSRNFWQCFQILGFDIMLDKNLRPWLLEVNESPSFNDDTEVDKRVKTGLIEDTMRLLNIRKSQKAKILEMEKEKNTIQRKKFHQLADLEMSKLHDKELKMLMDEQADYDQYQRQNLGNFEVLFPLEEGSLMSKRRLIYDRVSQVAGDLFDNQFGVKKFKEDPPIQNLEPIRYARHKEEVAVLQPSPGPSRELPLNKIDMIQQAQSLNDDALRVDSSIYLSQRNTMEDPPQFASKSSTKAGVSGSAGLPGSTQLFGSTFAKSTLPMSSTQYPSVRPNSKFGSGNQGLRDSWMNPKTQEAKSRLPEIDQPSVHETDSRFQPQSKLSLNFLGEKQYKVHSQVHSPTSDATRDDPARSQYSVYQQKLSKPSNGVKKKKQRESIPRSLSGQIRKISEQQQKLTEKLVQQAHLNQEGSQVSFSSHIPRISNDKFNGSTYKVAQHNLNNPAFLGPTYGGRQEATADSQEATSAPKTSTGFWNSGKPSEQPIMSNSSLAQSRSQFSFRCQSSRGGKPVVPVDRCKIIGKEETINFSLKGQSVSNEDHYSKPKPVQLKQQSISQQRPGRRPEGSQGISPGMQRMMKVNSYLPQTYLKHQKQPIN